MLSNIKLVDGDIVVRDISLDDCNQTYVSWLKNTNVNQFLETRWIEQDVDTIKSFVKGQIESNNNYLFAITIKCSDQYKHIGNIKIGGINPHHHYSEISYFIGDESYHGKGIATKAIELVSDFAFKKLGVHRIQASFYEENIATQKALEKAGYVYEGVWHERCISPITNKYSNVKVYYKLSSM